MTASWGTLRARFGRRHRPGDDTGVTWPLLVAASAGLLAGTISCASPRLASRPISVSRRTHPLPSDIRLFVPRFASRVHDTPGVLTYGGYYHHEARLRAEAFTCVDDDRADVRVETVQHPADYPYVVHDFFGAFLHTAETLAARAGSSGTDPAPSVRVLQWTNTRGRNTCLACCLAPRPEASDRNGWDGLVGWYRIEGRHITTVMLRCTGVRGLPDALINKKLAETRSDVPNRGFDYQGWREGELQKWIDTVKTQQPDNALYRLADARLTRLTGRAFAIADTLSNRDDPQSFQQALDETVRQLEARAYENTRHRED